ncbi:MAG TPA: hypothetical protein VHA82_12230 [Ramlibacter sp.]|uniref:hypothetical protein n=1 Tax=Ramlibacter sp. TaxID=1917967 RepID=UPI002C239682|nr:hypothetical protein [Ramlibacter sp.]HVZ44570.1 hypothetical protein [Ramlibacter sp.]
MKKATLIAAIVLYAAFDPTGYAQTIWRCGNEYSQKPCAGAKSFDASDPRTSDQAQAALDKAGRDAKLAREMEKDRIAEEKRSGGPVKMVVGVAPAEPPHAAASAAKHGKKKHHGKEPEFFTAVGPKKAK